MARLNNGGARGSDQDSTALPPPKRGIYPDHPMSKPSSWVLKMLPRPQGVEPLILRIDDGAPVVGERMLTRAEIKRLRTTLRAGIAHLDGRFVLASPKTPQKPDPA